MLPSTIPLGPRISGLLGSSPAGGIYPHPENGYNRGSLSAEVAELADA